MRQNNSTRASTPTKPVFNSSETTCTLSQAMHPQTAETRHARSGARLGAINIAVATNMTPAIGVAVSNSDRDRAGDVPSSCKIFRTSPQSPRISHTYQQVHPKDFHVKNCTWKPFKQIDRFWRRVMIQCYPNSFVLKTSNRIITN